MTEISKGLVKLAGKLFQEADEQKRFIDSITAPETQDICLIWLNSDEPGFSVLEKNFWESSFIYRVENSVKPGATKEHELGQFYCLDTSSVFSASVMKEIHEKPDTILDLCSSPGGKGIYAWRLFKPEMLICNEVIGKRIPALISNLKRCTISPSKVTNLDTRIFAEKFQSIADLVIVDAPCSGQSLLVKGKRSDGCFHPAAINMNSNRQKRILANASSTVKGGGHLAYMTCTFSPEENEKVIEWFLKRFSMFSPVEVEGYKEFQSHLTTIPCYRLWPHRTKGAGGFSCLLKKNSGDDEEEGDIEELRAVWKQG